MGMSHLSEGRRSTSSVCLVVVVAAGKLILEGVMHDTGLDVAATR